MRALYLVMVVMMLIATAMNVEGVYKKAMSCSGAGGTCRKACEKYEHGSGGYDCYPCCFAYKKG